MQVTRRYWAVAATGLVLVAGAVVLARPLLLAAAVGLGAWLLAAQCRFVAALARTDEALSIDLSLTPAHVATDERAHATLAVERPAHTALPITVRATPPVGTTGSPGDDRTVTLAPGDREATTTFDVTAPVAGAYRFESPAVTARDAAGLFEETFPRGPTPDLTVEPRAPRNVHVGAGEEAVAVAFGEHEAGRLGTGIEPAELREYQPGDQAHRIDWKATARLDHPYVREYEAETDRVAALLVDHRPSMDAGPPGETKLDYARQVALAFVESARQLDDPIGLYAVGAEGPTGALEPAATPGRYETVRRILHDLAPTGGPHAGTERPMERSPAAARAAARALDGEGTPFPATIRPYLEARDPYLDRIADDPLYETTKTHLGRLRGRVWTVLFTDDTHRAEVRETVAVARGGDSHVLVFLTPSVLFEPGGLVDIEAAYDRYVDFEEFRRELAAIPRVDAFEVAPGDRLDAVLDSGRQRRERRGRASR